MSSFRVLLIGAYGLFGRRLAERLSRCQGLHLIVAGRSEARSRDCVEALQAAAGASLQGLALDVSAPDFPVRLAQLRPQVVVHSAGPFQNQDYRVAQACLAAGAHYLDLADGRAFVAGIGVLDAEAVARGLLVTSGASSVPALSSAVADHLAQGLSSVHQIDIGISPGNRTERGLSTVQAILSYCGKPLPAGPDADSFGWSGSRWHTYPEPVGRRLLSPCDVPDLVLLGQRHPGRPSVRFGAGLELAVLHRGMNLMAALARMGWVHDWSRHARLLLRLADLFKGMGTDAGAMHVTVSGQRSDGVAVERTWSLVATQGDGPYVPTLAAAALVRKLCRGEPLPRGAQPCLGLLTLADFMHELEGLHIDTREAHA